MHAGPLPFPMPYVPQCHASPGAMCLAIAMRRPCCGVWFIGASCCPGWRCLLFLDETACRIRQYPCLHVSRSVVCRRLRGLAGIGNRAHPFLFSPSCVLHASSRTACRCSSVGMDGRRWRMDVLRRVFPMPCRGRAGLCSGSVIPCRCRWTGGSYVPVSAWRKCRIVTFTGNDSACCSVVEVVGRGGRRGG